MLFVDNPSWPYIPNEPSLLAWPEAMFPLDSTDRKLLICANILLALACLNLMDVCLGILFEHYYDRYCGRQERRDGEKRNRPSKVNKGNNILDSLLGFI
jgi:hypothetical protein